MVKIHSQLSVSTDIAPRWNTELKGEPPPTQIGRALRQLGIGWIAAHSLQAKVRQERFFGTAPDQTAWPPWMSSIFQV